MARGFWTGLGHGGALSAGALVLLALALPLPLPRPGSGVGAPLLPGQAAAPDVTAATSPGIDAKPDAGSEPDDTLATAAPTAAPPVVDAASMPAATPSAVARDNTRPSAAAAPDTAPAPEAQAVGLPVGSEFGRGSDVAPRLPAPLVAPDNGMRQSDAPAVSAPAAEPSPVAITGTPERPEAARSQPDAPRPASVDDAPGVARPPAADLPGFAAAPGLVAGAEQDAAPLTLPEPLPAARSEPAPDEQPETAAQATTELAVIPPDPPAVAVTSTPEPTATATTRPEATAPAQPAPLPASAGTEQGNEEVVETTRVAPAAPILRSPALDLSLPPDLSELRRGRGATE